MLVWRGPKTLPSLGKAFGQGVKEARKEIDEIKTDVAGAQGRRRRDGRHARRPDAGPAAQRWAASLRRPRPVDLSRAIG